MAARRAKKALDFVKDFNGSLDSLLESLPTQYLQCRSFGHSWRPANAGYNQADKVFEQSLKCTRCTATRSFTVSPSSGAYTSRTPYTYPDGYVVKGTGRMRTEDNNAIRLAQMMRLVP